MSDLSKERILVVLALFLCVAVCLIAASDTPELSPISVIYTDVKVTESTDSSEAIKVTNTGSTSSHLNATQTSLAVNNSTASGEKVSSVFPSGKININTADKELLITLPGIGEVYASRIIEYRETYGGFHMIEDIMNISGIGEKRFAEIKNFITIE